MIDEKRIIDKLESFKDNMMKKFCKNNYRTHMTINELCYFIDLIIEYINENNENKEDTDYAKVVRCKNCKWWQDNRCTNINGAYNTNIINPDWFCCSGMLKENT